MIHCIKCEIEKPDTEYYRSTIRANGTGECKTCTTARVRANRADHKTENRIKDGGKKY